MQIIKSLRSLLLFLIPLSGFAQSSYLMPGGKEEILLNRLEIKSATNENLNYSNIKPLSRRMVTNEVEKIDSLAKNNDPNAPELSAIDQYNIDRFLMNNSEWSRPRESYKSKGAPVFNRLYKTQGNMVEVNNPDFFMAINPVIQYQQSLEKGNNQNIYLNTRGIAMRGVIDHKVGFNLYFTENQERTPLYVQQFITEHKAVPGMGFYKNFKGNGGTDYFDIKGSLSWNVGKHIDMQFGYDKNFIGSGFTSLLLSDFSNNALFLKINTRIWKFNYENLFMELTPDFKRSSDKLLPKKYFRMNHLSINAAKWLNLGIFDAVMFGRKDHFDFLYMVPVLFVRAAEQQLGSPDNALLGIDGKANIAKKIQLYGQVVLDEFKLSEIKAKKGWWANKYGIQMGLKYIDVAGIKNLDLQLESNRVRPFTYSHFDSVANYTHYNQPFAHPLGANFQEYISILRYQPLKKLYLQAKIISWKQGLDLNGLNYGSNPLRNYNTRVSNYGFEVGSGNLAKGLNANFLASYELKENMFIDANLQNRSYKKNVGGNQNTTVLSLGFRWNMARRNFDF